MGFCIRRWQGGKLQFIVNVAFEPVVFSRLRGEQGLESNMQLVKYVTVRFFQYFIWIHLYLIKLLQVIVHANS